MYGGFIEDINTKFASKGVGNDVPEAESVASKAFSAMQGEAMSESEFSLTWRALLACAIYMGSQKERDLLQRIVATPLELSTYLEECEQGKRPVEYEPTLEYGSGAVRLGSQWSCGSWEIVNIVAW